MSKPRRQARRKITAATEPRFDDCPECKFFKPGNTNKACGDCGVGENFEGTVEELDPYADSFLSKSRD
jgi:ribosomal protein L32